MLNRIFLPLLLLSLTLSASSFAQSTSCREDSASLKTPTGVLKGSLMLPAQSKKKVPVALIIAGSGPTDRNGNGPGGANAQLQSNAYKKLAEGLCAQGIASLRYDKRGIAESKGALENEESFVFTTLVKDAADWARQLKEDKRFSKVIIIGHSEGSLAGMLAAQEIKADAFISLAGPGESADKLIRRQIEGQPAAVQEMVIPILDSLAAGHQVKEVNPMLFALFRPSVQPYLISWFQYDPQQQIRKLQMPALIIQGSTDLQVKEEDARQLAAAQPKAKLVILEGMNHVLKQAPADMQQNIATYGNPELPLAPGLLPEITAFIQKLKK